MRRNQKRGLSLTTVGLLALALTAVATYLAFTKEIPFRSHYEVEAVVKTANQLKAGSLVRIAGVNVGEVTSVEHVGSGEPASRIRMRLTDTARPIHKDAELKIRPRIFFEGNFFVDLRPGSPSAPEMGDGDTIPIEQTAGPVQFDQVLGTLQADTRKDLKTLLAELRLGFDDGGAEAINRTIPYWEGAYKGAAIVNEAMLGVREHDLSQYLQGAARVSEGLDRNATQLQSLITDLRITAGAFASRDTDLERALGELPRTLRVGQPALEAVNEALPPLRRFVADLRPGIRNSAATLDAQIPFVRQLRGLVSRAELRGLTADLRPTVPSLARLNKATVPLLREVRAASSCQNEVILPWTRDKIEDPDFPATGPVYQEQPKALVGLAGESRSFDANGQWFRVALNAGQFATPMQADRFLLSDRPILGANPPRPDQRSPLRPDVPCETQEQPDLRTRQSAPPQQSFKVRDVSSPEAVARVEQARKLATQHLRNGLRAEGKDVPVDDDLISGAELPELLRGLR